MFVAKNENTPTIDSKTVASADPKVSFDGKTVKIGQQLTYTVKATVPETADGYDSYPYSIQDVASKGLTIDGASITVQADGKVVNDYTVTGPIVGQTGETTTTITFANAKNYAGKQLVVTYNATVNDQIQDPVYRQSRIPEVRRWQRRKQARGRNLQCVRGRQG